MLAHIKRALKPGGRLVIVEPISETRRDGERQAQERQHEIAPQFVQQDARAAGFSIVGLEDPFSSHQHGSEYMLVLSPRDPATLETATPHDHEDGDVSAPDLRIAMDEFERLYRTGAVIVLDVRDSASYERGHIPSARLTPMDDLRNQLDSLRSATQPIVTYCSCPAEESSARAAAYLRKNGVTGVRALTGGFEKWAAGGRKVATGR
jgi:rhodanese-related sulfurtransferase